MAGLAAIDGVPVITMQNALVEDGSNATEEGVFPSVVADVVGLASGFLVGVHAVIVGQTVAGEASLWHSGVVGEVDAWLSVDGA